MASKQQPSLFRARIVGALGQAFKPVLIGIFGYRFRGQILRLYMLHWRTFAVSSFQRFTSGRGWFCGGLGAIAL
jgi:hypothetical protein